jgi:collagen type VII alpha
MNCQRTILTVSAVLMLALMTAFPAWAATLALSPGGSNVIKTAVEAAAPGSTFTLSAGVYTEDPFFIPSGVNIYGADRRTVTIQESASTGYQGGTAFIWVKGSNVNLAGFTAQGRGVKGMTIPGTTLPNDNSAKYGINTAGSLNSPVVNNTSVTLTNITSRYFNGTGVNINGANGMTLNKVESVYNNGAGVYLSDAHNITINNVTTAGNSWGGVCVNVYGATFAAGTSGIVFSGANSFGESGSGGYGLWLESDAYPNHHQNGELITYSDNPAAGAQVTIQASDFSYASDAIYFDFTGDNLTRRLFFASAADASAFLTPLNAAIAPLGRSYNMVALSAGSTFAKSIFSSLPAATLETLTGPAGPTGATGSQGPSGLNGLPGATGPTGPAGASAAALDIRNKVAIQKGGDRLSAVQVSDGGFAWPLTGGSAQNIIAPTAMGLAQAYLQTASPTQRLAVQNAGAFLLAKTNTFAVSDGYLAAQLDRILGGSIYRDYIKANFYDKLSAGTYMVNTFGTVTGPYNLAGFLAFRHNYRAGGQSNVAAWDIGISVVSASAVGVDTAPWLAQLQTEINALDAAKANDILGLAGAVYGLATTGTNFVPSAGEFAGAAGIKGLADRLAAFQVNGTTFSKVSVPQDNDFQTTAYAVLALNQADRYSYLGNILSAADFMSASQLPTGGWEMSTGSGEYNEATGEVLWAITAADYSLQGLKGDKGEKGDKGDKGDTGEQGPIGQTGATGSQGPIGLTGATGSQGPIGQTGATGSQGPIGLTGATGAVGPAGSPDTQAQILTKLNQSVDGAAFVIRQGQTELSSTNKIRLTDPTGAIDKISMSPSGVINVGSDAASPSVFVTSSTDQAGQSPVFTGRKSRGSLALPTAVQTGDNLFTISGIGYNGTNWPIASTAIVMPAREAFTTTGKGADIAFLTTQPGTTNRSEKFRVTGEGNVGVGTSTPTQKLEVVGSVKATSFIGDGTQLTGIIGQQGPKGDTGAQGPIGLTGVQGPIGLTGVQGPKGDTGAQGPIGLTGVQGPKGDTGAQGPIGLTGVQGPKGDTGAQGPIGLTGVQGPKGDTGAQGPIGLTGATGATGSAGAQGPQGDKGDIGAIGARGLTFKGPWDIATSYSKDDSAQFGGATYIALANVAAAPSNNDPSADSTNWQMLAAKGTKGDTGDQGPVGPIGIGVVGPEGPQGPIGLTGATGATGSTGAHGLQGDKGDTGATGAQGLTFKGPWDTTVSYNKNDATQAGGATYIALADVAAAPTNLDPTADPANWQLLAAKGGKGDKGDTGEQGPIGLTGATGTTGAKGDKGDAGATGVQGPIGLTGATGPQGSIGLTGTQGPAGSPDTQAQILAKIALTTDGSGVLALTSEGASPSMILNSQTGTTGQSPVFTGRKSRGTVAAPVAVQTGDNLFTLSGIGYNGSAWPTASVAITMPARETFTATAKGADIVFLTTPPGTTARAESLRVTGEGNLGVGVAAPAQKLEINGGARLNTVTPQPACSATIRGTFWFTQSAAGVKDSAQVCAKDAADVYAWRTMY